MWIALVLAGCPKDPDAGVGIEGRLAEADRAWDARAAVGLGPSGEALAAARALDPRSPEVLWRWSRWSVARGLAAEDEAVAVAAFADAREAAMSCLALPVDFSWTGPGDPFVAVRPDRGPCASWAAFAWVRWWLAFGPEAAALDAPRIVALADLASRLGGDPGQVAWVRGLVLAAGGDPVAGGPLIDAAIDAEPADLWRQVDRIEWVLLARGDFEGAAEARDAVLAAGGGTPEDVAARRRAGAP